jgi:hypothetical protein
VDFIELPGAYNWLVVKASIDNNREDNFMLDTGGNAEIEMDSAYFFENWKTEKYTLMQTKVKMWYWDKYVIGDFEVKIGNHTFAAKKILLYNFSHKQIDKSLKGFIGFKAFENKMTVIDYDNKKIAFLDNIDIDPSYYSAKLLPGRNVNDNNKHLRFVEIKGFKDKKGKDIPALFLLDTGNATTALFMKRNFGLKLSNMKKELKKVPAVVLANNHTIYNWSFKLDSISLGNFNLLELPARYETDISDRIELLDGAEGLLGIVLLRRFNMIIDYKNNMFYFKPNKSFPKEKMY